MIAASPARLHRRRSLPWRWLATAGAGVLVTIAVMAGARLVDGSDDAGTAAADSAEVRRQVGAYRAAVAPLAQEGGRVVVQGLRPGMADIRESRLASDVLVGMATQWVDDLRDVRGQLAGLDHPAFLDHSHRLYLQALDGYVNAARTLLAAARADGTVRVELVTLAADLGQAADGLYDEAEAELDELAKAGA